VIATGHCDLPAVPRFARFLPPGIKQLTASEYRNPAMLPQGGVLTVGASATGVQIADEIRRSGRAVIVSVGRHTRLPRSYRGKDIWHWLERIGVLDEKIESVRDVGRARRAPSFQLVGDPGHRTLDLEVLQEIGIRLAGRCAGVHGGVLCFRNDL